MTSHVRVHRAIALAALLASTPAFAQVAEPPPRPSRPRLGGRPPLDPNRVRHDLTFDASLFGGYEDNATPFGQALTGVNLRPSVTVSSGDVGLRYSVGTPRSGFDISGRGSANYASTHQRAGVPPGWGADVGVGGRIGLGRYTRLSTSQRVQVAPYGSLGVFGGMGAGMSGGGLGSGGLNVEANVANSLFEGRTLGATTSASVDHEWSRGTSTAFSYSFNRQAHEDRTLLDNKSHSAKASFSRRIGRAADLRTSYAAAYWDAFQRGRAVQSLNHTADVGFGFTRRLSRTRMLSASFGAGATRVDRRDSVRQKYWMPTSYASGGVDIGRSWAFSADWRQSANVVPSPVFTPRTFLSNAVTLSVGGNLSRRLELVVSAGNSNGFIPSQANDGSGSYNGLTSSAQMRIALTEWWSALVMFNHYRASLDGVAAEAFGISKDFQRSSVAVGFGWSLPIFDSGARRIPQRGGRQ